MDEFTALGKTVSDLGRKFDTFPTPDVEWVTYESDEVTALCPVTGQPDWYTVKISMIPEALCIESKSLKLYLQSFRNEGHFCEQFAAIIADDILEQVKPKRVEVVVIQKPRGGVTIRAEAVRRTAVLPPERPAILPPERPNSPLNRGNS